MGTGLEAGTRIGYARPTGGISRQDDLSLASAVAVPVFVDVGYRWSPSLYAGGFVQFAHAFVNEDDWKICAVVYHSCSITMIRLGIDLRHRFWPDRQLSPWLGAGMGYEFMSLNSHARVLGESPDESLREVVVRTTWQGPEVLHLDAGADVRVGPVFLGPFLSASLARYSSERTSWSEAAPSDSRTQASSGSATKNIADRVFHSWIMLGIRGSFVVSTK